MNLSKTQDPFRFLKRKKNVTPQKLKDNSLEEHYKILPDNLSSLAESKISKIEETNSKENHYDPNKYYSSKCQNYLKTIKFQQRQQSKRFNNTQKQVNFIMKTDEPTDQLPILKTKQKEMPKTIIIKQNQARQLTFKKLDFQSQSQKQVQPKKIDQPNVQLKAFNEQDYEIQDGSSANAQRKECPICGRHFNLAPYEKHIKVCEKVFMKKRKPFSSQKQRSLSKQKKNN